MEVFGAKVLVESAVAQHVVGGGEDRCGDRADGLLGTATMPQALELCLQVAVFLSAPCLGALHERGLEPCGTFA